MTSPSLAHPPGAHHPRVCQRILGRYALYGEIAHGGMATVHLGRLLGPVGFSRTVAIKRLHPQFSKDPDFVSMFLDEARLAARIRHPNVVSVLDVVALEGELFLVMDYVPGESVARVLRKLREKKERIPARLAVAILTQVLAGLHAAHEAKNERGEPLHLVHRDMSPQNVMLGLDGVARVLDFGIAKAQGRVQTTREGQLKGKLSYVAPEQLKHGAVDRRTDVYAAAVTLWELLTGRRLFKADSEYQLVHQITEGEVFPPSHYVPELPAALDAVVMRGLAREAGDRYPTARAMGSALLGLGQSADEHELAEWLESVDGEVLRERAALVAEIETDTSVTGILNLAHFPLADPRKVLVDPQSGRAHPAAALEGASNDVGARSSSLPPAEATEATATRPEGRAADPAARALRDSADPPAPGSIPAGPTSSGAVPAVQRTESNVSSLISQHSIVPPPPAPQRSWLGRAALVIGLLAVVGVASGGVALGRSSGPQVAYAAPRAFVHTAKDAAPPPVSPQSSVPSVAPSSLPLAPPTTLRFPYAYGRPLPGTPPSATVAAPIPPAPRADCNPPYTVDAEGIRHAKPQCM